MRPASIKMFDRLYLALIVLSVIDFALSYDTTIADLQANSFAAEFGTDLSGMLFGVYGIDTAISLLLWFLISRKANNVARWILVVLVVIGLLFLPFELADLPLLQGLTALVLTIVSLAMAYLLFRPDAKGWFVHGPKGMDTSVFE